MELVRKTIHMIRQKGKAVSQMTLDDDYNIPETMPDAGMIVQEKGKIDIEEIKAENGRVLLRGALKFFILYMDDAEESSLHSVKGQIPFEETMNVESAGDGDSLKLDWMLEDISAVLINSRKFGIKTVATLELSVEELRDEEVPVAVEGTEGIKMKTCPMSAAALAVRKRDTSRIKDEIILPANKPNIRQIIWQDTVMQGTELRLAEGEVVIKGELVVFILYEGEEEEGKASWLEQILPFNSRVDVNGCQEGMVGSLKLELAGFTFYIDQEDAVSDTYKAAFTELLEALPPAAVLSKGSGSSAWQETEPAALARTLGLDYTPRSFSDISASPFREEIDTLAAYQLLGGYEDGGFHPQNTVTRAEFCAMIATALNLSAGDSAPAFSDVSPDAWYAGSVAAMAAKGFVAGCGDGTFQPDATITYQEMVTILSSVAAWCSMEGYSLSQTSVTAEEWMNYYQFAQWAITPARNLDKLGALVGDLAPTDLGTREVAAGMLCSLLEGIHLLWD